eukprot:6208238-Pleurochrysis_carterae.AAC.3
MASFIATQNKIRQALLSEDVEQGVGRRWGRWKTKADEGKSRGGPAAMGELRPATCAAPASRGLAARAARRSRQRRGQQRQRAACAPKRTRRTHASCTRLKEAHAHTQARTLAQTCGWTPQVGRRDRAARWREMEVGSHTRCAQV